MVFLVSYKNFKTSVLFFWVACSVCSIAVPLPQQTRKPVCQIVFHKIGLVIMVRSRGHIFFPQIYAGTLPDIAKILFSFLIAAVSPALFYACTAEEAATQMIYSTTIVPEIHAHPTKAESWWLVRRLDVFVFDEGDGSLMDSYQQSFLHRDHGVTVWSGSGRRKAVVIANLPVDVQQAASICIYEDLQQLCTSLRSDNPQYPVMCGEISYMAGTERQCRVTLTPVLCELDISLKCVFGSEGEQDVMEAVQVYLTGLSAGTGIITDGQEPYPRELLCYPELSEADLRSLTYPRMVCQYLGNIGDGPVLTTLYCYPNPAKTVSAGIGSPVTTLIIEGYRGTDKYSYSLPLEDLQRGTRYEINIRIENLKKS